jgi:S1-C subfamily serine protease
MNFIDIFIILFAISALLRGREIGFVRQFCSTSGFVGGLWLGATLQPHLVHFAHTDLTRTLITLGLTLGFALLLLSVGEYLGLLLKHKILTEKHVNPADNGLGSVLAVVSLLLVVWLSANIFASLPYRGMQQAISGSGIIRLLDEHLPAAPSVVADLGRLVDPNGFPDVFTGVEPTPDTRVTAPNLANFSGVINTVQPSVVKVEGEGCGGIVEGSGFVIAKNVVVTNAHVVAGISRIHIEDVNGDHLATAIWFDPNLDVAVLSTSNLAGAPLSFGEPNKPRGTPGVVLGYPGGGAFQAGGAAILSEFTAVGRNIYGQKATARDVYELQATVIPGNSGGPLVSRQGKVIGVVFAESTTYQHVGYALTVTKVEQAVRSAELQDKVRSTGSCAE